MSSTFDATRNRANEIRANAVIKELTRRGFKAEYAMTREVALAKVLDLIPAGATVGIPGTVTIREIGAVEALQAKGCKVFQHWSGTPEERAQAREAENKADFFLTSANALTAAGEIINIDGTGNRVLGMAYGPGVLVFVVGMNKLAGTLEEGIKRARTATIPNVLRLGGESSCTKAGRCVDCRADTRICNAVLILEAPTLSGKSRRETHVILVGENLGF